MDILVINMIAGRLDRLEALIEQVGAEPPGAIFVLGNVVELPAQPAAAIQPDSAEERYSAALKLLGSLGAPIFLIPGEYDPSLGTISHVIQTYRGPASIHLVHRTAAPLGMNDVVAGFGGQLTLDDEATIRPMRYPAWEARVAFEHLHAYNDLFRTARRHLLLFATPPQAAQIDRQEGAGQGVALLNSLIRAYQPALVCCAGPPSGRGVETISGARVVNPGSLAEGSYALVDLEQLSVRLRRLPEPIRLDAPFRSIVVAIDGSPQSWRAFELAASVAQFSAATLTLVYAWEPISIARGQPYHDDAVAQRIAAGEQLLAQICRALPELPVEQEVLEGPAAAAIVRVAQAHHADLIVMGARGLGALRRVLGSVSQRVLHDAPCPVLIAREPPQHALLLELSRAFEAGQL